MFDSCNVFGRGKRNDGNIGRMLSYMSLHARPGDIRRLTGRVESTA